MKVDGVQRKFAWNSAKAVFSKLCQDIYLFIYLFCNSPTDHTVMTEITSVKAAGQQGSELR